MQNKIAYYLDWLEMILLCATALLVPLYVKFTPPLIAALSLLFLVRARNYTALKQSARNIGFWAMLFPFFLYLIGITYSEDIATALKNTETTLSLLAFPLIATSYRQNGIRQKEHLLRMSFVLGVIIVMSICSVRGLMQFAHTGDNSHLFYTGLLPSPHHHSYYVLFALFILVCNLFDLEWKSNKCIVAIEIVSSILMALFIGLLSSKITILLLIAFAIYIIVRMLLSKSIHKAISIATLICFVAIVPALYSIPMVKFRFDSMITSIKAKISGEETRRTKTESTTIRLKCIEASFDVISENILFGTGQGDVYAELEKKMKQRVGDDYDGTCSSHNQFLRTFASFGIPGIASLLLLFAVLFYNAFKQKDHLMILWAFACTIFFCVEDMLCIINGIIFFSLFTSMFLIGKDKSPKA